MCRRRTSRHNREKIAISFAAVILHYPFRLLSLKVVAVVIVIVVIVVGFADLVIYCGSGSIVFKSNLGLSLLRDRQQIGYSVARLNLKLVGRDLLRGFGIPFDPSRHKFVGNLTVLDLEFRRRPSLNYFEIFTPLNIV